MPRVTWDLTMGHRRHTVILDYDVWWGSRTLTVDGVLVDRQVALLGLWSDQAFKIRCCSFQLTTRPAWKWPWSLVVELHNAGRVLPPTSVTP
jgi:hypothetical protein